jgi:hypothetical protein
MPRCLQTGQEAQDKVRWRVRNKISMNGWVGWCGAFLVIVLALSGSILSAHTALDTKDRCPIASPLTGDPDVNLPKGEFCKRLDGQIQAGGGCICCYPNRVCACTFVEECGRTGGVCTGPC